LWFEELDEFSGMEDVRTIKASVFRGMDAGVAFMTYNPPQSARSWVNAEALVPRPDRQVHSSDYRDMPPEWLGSAFIDEAEYLRQTNERAWRHMYLGEITGTGGQVFDNLELRTLTDEEANAERSWCGLDFGFAVDPDAFIVVQEAHQVLGEGFARYSKDSL
jgi:phage terminase large subunit